MIYGMAMALALAFIAGCAGPPSIPIVGAFFPDWVFCIAAGVVLAVIVRAVLASRHAERILGPPVLVFPTLALLLSLLIWLIVFKQ